MGGSFKDGWMWVGEVVGLEEVVITDIDKLSQSSVFVEKGFGGVVEEMCECVVNLYGGKGLWVLNASEKVVFFVEETFLEELFNFGENSFEVHGHVFF